MKSFVCFIVYSFLVGCSVAPKLDLFPLRAKAEAGDSTAMILLALAYDSGREVPLDQKEAAKWYLRSAEAGSSTGQNSIGSMYQAGEGVGKDYAQARIWYEKSARQGNLEGIHNLAFLYDEGLGVPQDNRKAIELYTSTAELGFAKSMLNLGTMHRQGDGIPVNLIEAYKWLDLARFYTQKSRDMRLKWLVRGQLDEVKKQMSTADVAIAEKLGTEWDRIHRRRD